MPTAAVDDEGFVEHRGHRVWWGSREPDQGDTRPAVLVVHGGPGLPHDYLEPLAALAERRRIVFYDQYGCGRSDRADDPAEYTIELFVSELAAVRRQLGLDRVHVLAHSYGGPLALEYLLQTPDPGVVSLVLSNSFGSVAALARGWERRFDELPSDVARGLRAGPDSPDYGPALGQFIAAFVLTGPLPEAVLRAQAASGGEVYARMHGPSWFEPHGAWADWDALPRLGSLDIRTLIVGGHRDQCVPDLAESLHAALPRSELAVLDAAHLPFTERPDEYLPLIADFLSRADDDVQRA